jgi:HSP90 family molecular chaperone
MQVTKRHNTLTSRQLKKKGYEVLLLDSPIISHLIQKIEGDNKDMTFVRVDSDHIDNNQERRNYHF